MKSMRLLLLLMIYAIYNNIAFQLKCPHTSQRQFRALSLCKGNTESNYSCLLDIYKEIYNETCDQPANFVLRGEQYVISGGRKPAKCPSDTYQPFNFWSDVQSQCYYKKSLCNDNGQLIYSQISTKDDNTCRCDYTQGYVFVTKPKNLCYCIPSEEDCTCYSKTCPVDTRLSSNYECISKVSAESRYSCSVLMSTTTQIYQTSKEAVIVYTGDENEIHTRSDIPVYLISALMIFIIMVFAATKILHKRQRNILQDKNFILVANKQFLIDEYPHLSLQKAFQRHVGNNNINLSLPKKQIIEQMIDYIIKENVLGKFLKMLEDEKLEFVRKRLLQSKHTYGYSGDELSLKSSIRRNIQTLASIKVDKEDIKKTYMMKFFSEEDLERNMCQGPNGTMHKFIEAVLESGKIAILAYIDFLYKIGHTDEADNILNKHET